MANGMRIKHLSIEEEDGVWWVKDWAPTEYGNSITERSWFAFKSKRHAEQFMTAAKRAVQP